MTVQYASNLSATRLPVAAVDPWVRPAEWMELPVIPANTQRVHLLMAVFENSPNYFAVTVDGNYQIDWGDGAGWVNYSSGTRADKELDWSAYASNPTTLNGARQALVTIEPQSGQNLTSLNFNVRHASMSVTYSTGLLDMQISSPQLATLTAGAANPAVIHPFAQRVGIQGATSISSITFRAAWRSMVVFDGADWAGGSLSFLGGSFVGCSALRQISLFDTSTVADFSECFANCVSLRTVPAFDMSACTIALSMFSGCGNLTSVPLFDLSALTNANQMFHRCYNLTSVPLFDLSAVTNANQMFDASGLQSVPAFDLSSATTTRRMFLNCPVTGSATFSLPQCTSIESMFQNTGISSITLTNLGNVTTTSLFLNSTTTVTSITLGGLRATVSVASNQLSPAALDALYTSLGTALTGAAITVTTNPGTTGDNPAIATAKGWTVTGS